MWRYVKSGYGGQPYLWRLLHPAQHGAWQSDSHAPAGYAGCRLPPLVLQYSQSPIPKITPSPINRTSLRSLRAVTLFASKKGEPRQPSAPCKQALKAGERLASWRQIALPEYRQVEHSGSCSALPSSSLKPTPMQEALCSPEQPPSVIRRTNRGGAVEQPRSVRLRSLSTAAPRSQQTIKKYLILARLKAEELLRRARMKRFGKNEITQKKLIPNTQSSPDIRAILLQLPGCHAFCKKNSKKHAPALRFRKKALKRNPTLT